MAPPKKSSLPIPLPEGFVLRDTQRKRWRLGRIIGQGGFGLIYLASQDVDRPVAADTAFVIKVEYMQNGPLFTELKFYQRAAKAENIEKWKRRRGLSFLGVPAYWGTGLAEYNNLSYRFMAMDRLGSDLQKICERSGGRLKKATVLQLGHRLVSVLEYIHENEYVHADIKAANLMLSYTDPDQVYLADYGLSYRYCPSGVHKEYKENPKKGHNGTIEYTSLDAHRGLDPSRRGDLQILGFCLLHWLCGSLPWGDVLKDPRKVQTAKERLMDQLPLSVQTLSIDGLSTDEVARFLLHVKTLDYQDKPDYQHLQDVLASGSSGSLDFLLPPAGPPNQQKPERSRTSPNVQPVAEDKNEKRRTKAVPARSTRGPPPRNPQVEEREDAVLSARCRSLRPRAGINYREHSSEEEEEEEEEEEAAAARPLPIPARYLRGPPGGPGSKQL